MQLEKKELDLKISTKQIIISEASPSPNGVKQLLGYMNNNDIIEELNDMKEFDTETAPPLKVQVEVEDIENRLEQPKSKINVSS